uniref:Uncharacterized protein n=1 Tax=Medicago truncatula TaxID=3880 RepID=I3S937_MEDTR|nr:unknown [Medicago truncatula]
MQMGQRRI